MSKAGASLATRYGPVSTHVMTKSGEYPPAHPDVDGVLSRRPDLYGQ